MSRNRSKRDAKKRPTRITNEAIAEAVIQSTLGDETPRSSEELISQVIDGVIDGRHTLALATSVIKAMIGAGAMEARLQAMEMPSLMDLHPEEVLEESAPTLMSVLPATTILTELRTRDAAVKVWGIGDIREAVQKVERERMISPPLNRVQFRRVVHHVTNSRSWESLKDWHFSAAIDLINQATEEAVTEVIEQGKGE